jgi:hypothetical protein
MEASLTTVNERIFSVALVQSEQEVLHTPALDLSAFLASDPRWEVQLFTDRNFEGMVETASHFDCLILGFNVVHQTRELREMLEQSMPDTGVVVLHQLKSEAISFLPVDLRVEVCTLHERKERVVLPTARPSEEEVLLNWPETVPVEEVGGGRGLSGSALCYLEGKRPEKWRSFLDIEEDGRRFPVGLRTLMTDRPRVVICNLWLEPAIQSHAALVANMIRYCAVGIPDVAVLRRDAEDGLGLLARKVELQGANVSQLQIDKEKSGSPFLQWPLRSINRAVVADDYNVDEEWCKRGGILITVTESGELSLSGGNVDEYWIAERWAAWYSAVESVEWHGGTNRRGRKRPGSIFQSRAVLRMLSWFVTEAATAARRLQIRAPEDFASVLSKFISPRVKLNGSAEGTVSTTAAVFDIHTLTNELTLSTKDARRVEGWLRNTFESDVKLSLADEFDIARALKDKSLLESTLKRLRADMAGAAPLIPGARQLEDGTIALSPMIVTRLRQACVAVASNRDESYVNQLVEGVSEDDVADLSNNLLLAAEYLGAVAAFSKRFPLTSLSLKDESNSHQLRGGSLDQSIAALGKFGRLVRLDANLEEWRAGASNGEVISTEALSLVEYFGVQPPPPSSPQSVIRNTNLIAARDRGLPPVAVGRLVAEVQRAQKELADAEPEFAALSRARHFLGALALLIALTVGIWTISSRGFDATTWVFLPVAAITLFPAWLLLKRLNLAPNWLESPAQVAAAITPGPVKAIFESLQKRKSDAAPND